MEEWEDKLKELERKGMWETVTKEKLPVDDDDKTNAFVFKLLWKILTTELYNVSKHTCNWILCIRYALLFSRTLNQVVFDRDVMVKFEPCEYTRKMIFRSVTQSCQSALRERWFFNEYIFTLIFTSSFLFSRLKKANGLQRICLVVYKLFVVVIIIIRIFEFDVLYGSFCLVKFYILDLVTACL